MASFEQQILVIRSNLLAQLRKGDYENREAVFDFGSFIKMDLYADYYASAIVRIIDYPDTKGRDGEIYLLKSAILNVIQAIFDTRTEKGFAVQLNRSEIGIVFCLKCCDTNPDWYRQLKLHIGKIRNILIRDYQMTFLISVGGVYQDVNNIKRSYDEAVKAMNYIVFNDKNIEIFYNDIQFCRDSYTCIHMNNGLHGLDKPIGLYAGTYEKLLNLVLSHCERVILASTTHVTQKGDCRVLDIERTEAVKQRNRVITELSKRYNLPLNDLYVVTINRPDIRLNDAYHFTEAGYRVLAEQVYQSVLKTGI